LETTGNHAPGQGPGHRKFFAQKSKIFALGAAEDLLELGEDRLEVVGEHHLEHDLRVA
jgi:hypothetical protein